MREIGKIIELNDRKAKILIKRSTACGNCGACQVGKDNLNMILTADNDINAKIGDNVEIDMQTSNFLLATVIAYGIPLASLIIGTVGAFYLLKFFKVEYGSAQGASAFIGLLFLGLSYILIKSKEPKISSMSHFKPSIVRICDDGQEVL